MEIYSHPDIQEIIFQEGNSQCFDCNSAKPKWASINNGIFLCLKCAGLHRNFGLNISVIRSLQIDSWDEKQITFLKKGGNAKYQAFLSEYNIQKTSSVDLKYKSKAAEYYRKYLRYQVEKIMNPNFSEPEPTRPDLTLGLEIIEIKSNSGDISNNDIIGSKKEPEPKQETFFGFVGSFFKKAGQKVVESSLDLKKKVEDLEIGSKLKETGKKTVDFVQKGGQFVVEKGQEVYKSDFVQGITQKAEEGINVIVDSAKQLIDQNPNKEKDTPKEEGPKINNESQGETNQNEPKNSEDKEEKTKVEEQKEANANVNVNVNVNANVNANVNVNVNANANANANVNAPEEIKKEEPKSEEAPNSQENKSEGNNTEEAKPEESKPEEVKSEDKKPEENKSEETKTEEKKSEENTQ